MRNIKLLSGLINYIFDASEIEKERALYEFKHEMAIAEISIRNEGTISAEALEKELECL